MSPDTTRRTAGLVAASAIFMFSNTNTLVDGYSYGWGNVNDNGNGTPSMFHQDSDDDISIDSTDIEHLKENQTKPNMFYERYINKITKILI